MAESLQNKVEPSFAKSTLLSKNITIGGRRTSVRLEPEMWEALREITTRENCTIHEICTLIVDCKKEDTSTTAAIRVFLMLYFRASSTPDGHAQAGHGDFKNMKLRALARTNNKKASLCTNGNSKNANNAIMFSQANRNYAGASNSTAS